MTHLYITDNGSVLGVDGGCYVVSNKHVEIARIPMHTLESVSIFGRSTITTPCIQKLLSTDVSVSYFSSRGRYYGKLQSVYSVRPDELRKQFLCADNEEFCLAFARLIISAKLHNQYVVAKRYAKDKSELENSFRLLKQMEKKVFSAEDLTEVMGYEGIGAKTYFHILSEIVHPDFKFYGRNKRPPKDPFNAMLSFGYSLLLAEITSIAEIEGLNPYFGFLHQERGKNPALCNDLMEEWRPVLVDTAVLSMIQGNEVHFDDFTLDSCTGGVYMSNESVKKIICKFEEKINGMQKYQLYHGNACSFRDAIHMQCTNLITCMETNSFESYKAMRIR